VLSAAGDPDGECVLVATERAVYHRLPAGGGWARLGWEEVARVGWDAVACQLIVSGVGCPVGGAAAARFAVPLRQRGAILELALERVAHTRLGQWQLHVGGRRRAVIEARRRPVTGELLWSMTPDADELGDVDIQLLAKRAIARLSAEFGALPQPGTGPSLF
jgi:hypothetical protein